MTTWQRNKNCLCHISMFNNALDVYFLDSTQFAQVKLLMLLSAFLQVFVVIEETDCLIGVYFNLNWVTQWAVLVHTVERNFPWCFCFNCLSLDLGRILSSVNNASWDQVSPVTTLCCGHQQLKERRNGHKLVF